MRTISDTTQFSLHYLIFKDRILRSDLPENLSYFCTDSTTSEPLTISFRCNDDEWFDKILVLSYKDGGVLNPIKKYSLEGIYGKSGGPELISEYLLSNFITDIEDPEYTDQRWVDMNGNEPMLDTTGYMVVDEISQDFKAPYIWDDVEEFTFNNVTYHKKFLNNLTLAPDFRNLILKREYPSFDFDDYGTIYGKSRFQYNINQENLKKYWLDDYSVPEYIFELLTSDQKNQAAKFLSSIIESDWKSVLKKIFNQEFIVEKK